MTRGRTRWNKCLICYSHRVLGKYISRLSKSDMKTFNNKYDNVRCEWHRFVKYHHVKEKILLKKENKYHREFFKQNVLTKITSKIKKYKIASFDIETHGYKNNVLLTGVTVDTDKQKDVYRYFFERAEAQQYIEDIGKKDLYIMATNLMFDFEGLYFDTNDWDKFKVIMRNGNILTASLINKEKDTYIRFSDTINYTHSSVKKLGKQIGLPKLGYEENMGKVPRTFQQWKLLIEYNERDCLISKRWTEIFQDILNKLGCELKLTIASCSMDLFRRKYLENDIYKEHIDCKDFIFQSYYGGRVECFKRGKLSNISINVRDKSNHRKYYYWYDYNSAYPYQMLKSYPLPSSAKETTNSSIDLIKQYHGCSDVSVDIPYNKYPLLPLRRDDKLIFPYGTFRGVYNHIEIRRAIELYGEQCIKKIHKTLYYTKEFYPFKKFVTELYALRMLYKKQGNLIMSEICKLLMNSLYGKFATKNLQEIEFFDFEKMTLQQQIDDDKRGRFNGMKVTKAMDGLIKQGYSEHEKENNQNYIFPIWSSCVTAYQRVDLHKDIVRLKGIYCDTDSILSTIRIEDNFELGGLKLEKRLTRGWIIRPKCYMIYDITKDDDGKFKGWSVRVKGINQMTPEKFVDILYQRGIEQFKFMKIKEALTHQYTPNQKKKFKKIQDNEDTKRNWLGQEFNKLELQDSEPIFIDD